MNQNPHTPPGRSGVLRAVFAAAGLTALLLAAAFLAAGGGVLAAKADADSDGYNTTSSHTFSTSGAALTSENLDLDIDGADWLMEVGDDSKLRVDATSQSGEPLFVGVARTADVERYLSGVAHTVVEDFGETPTGDVRNPKDRRSAERPAQQDIWVASTTGKGEQVLSWNVMDGDWTVVVMNADGSPAVSADVAAGAKLPFLTAVGWGSLGGGVLFLVLAGGMALLALNRGGGRRAAVTTVPRRPGATPSGGATA
jgi:hypothetical protein